MPTTELASPLPAPAAPTLDASHRWLLAQSALVSEDPRPPLAEALALLEGLEAAGTLPPALARLLPLLRAELAKLPP